MKEFPTTFKKAHLINGKVNLTEEAFPSNNINDYTLVIKPLYVGICRADVKELIGSRDIPEDRGPLFGHEFIGHIEYAGSQTDFKEGEHVTFNPNITPNRTTAYAEYFFIKDTNEKLNNAVIKIDKKLIDPKWQPEPFACIIHSFDKFIKLSNIKDLSKVYIGIIGAGNSGLLFALYAKYLGAKVKMFNRGDARINFSIKSCLLDKSELEKLNQYEEYQKAFDVVIVVPTKIENDTLQIAERMVKNDGYIHLYGGTRNTDVFLDTTINVDEIRRNETIENFDYKGKTTSLTGAYGCDKNDFLKAIDLYKNNHEKFQIEKLVSKEISLQEFPALINSMAYEDVDYPGKVIVIP